MPAMSGETPSLMRRVLVVDDEATVRSITERSLRRLGYDVIALPGGAEAIALYENGDGGSVDCVLLDLTMPRPDGVQVFETITAIQPGSRVILMSGYSEQDALPQLSTRPAAFLQKPYTLQKLHDTIEAVLA
ncbi:MAG: response regulator [Dehalococcoidia bacterium]|nr:response regulator [Dehalococcoidia bacterium]